MPRTCIDTPTGPFEITETEGAITRATWTRSDASDATPLLQRAAEQVAAYFAGSLTTFDLPLRVAASPCQQQVCAQIAAIPFGETLTYGDIARTLGAPPQAVGAAVAAIRLP